MNKKLNRNIFYILIFLTFSCVNNETKKKQSIQKTIVNPENKVLKIETELIKGDELKKNETIFIDSTNYKFLNLVEFNLQDWYSGKIEKELKPLTKRKLSEYFQNKRINGENIYPTNFRYFSIQKNTAEEKIITIIESDESCCSELHYLIYNEKNELLSDNIIAGTGGDGMWSYEKYGKFLNDSTYVLTKVEFEEIELKNEKAEIRIDSIITNYRFNKNRSFENIKERKFNKTIEK